MSSEESPEKASTELEEVPESSTIPPTTTWQAIFAPQYNTYYFYNPVTQETTWINPLQQPQPEASTSTTPTPSTGTSVVETETEVRGKSECDEEDTGAQATTSAASARYAALQDAALAQGIDPLLAHLDPSLLAPSVPGSSGGSSGMFSSLISQRIYLNIALFLSFLASLPPSPTDLPSFTARFNSRTGQFTPATARQPGHLSEHERAKRMSEFYFDVGKWEEDLARRGGRLMGEEEDPAGEEGTKEKKRKRPSKKDLVCVCAFFLPFLWCLKYLFFSS
jgi:hypothetical protein